MKECKWYVDLSSPEEDCIILRCQHNNKIMTGHINGIAELTRIINLKSKECKMRIKK